MSKKLLALILLVVIIIASTVYYMSISAPVTLAIDKIYNVTSPGSTILVNIIMSNSPKCSGWMVDLAWDPYILAVSMGDPNGTVVSRKLYNIYEGPFTKNVRPADIFLASEVNNAAGIIKGLAAAYITSGEFPQGSGILATINFTVLHAGTTTIEIKNAIIADENNKVVSHVELSSGLVTEKSAPPIWESIDFQFKVVVIETVVLSVSSGILIWKNTPKKPKKGRKGPIYENNFVFDF